MTTVGRFHLSRGAISIVIVFVFLSILAVVSAIVQARPEMPMPLSGIIIINEGMALIGTLVYGIILHVATSLFKRPK